MHSAALGREIRPIDRLIGHYAESHRHPTNIAIHWVCVPIIVWCTLTLFWVIHPAAAVAAVLGSLIYYVRLAPVFAGVMALYSALCLISLTIIPHAGWIALGVFVAAWIAQFIGHQIEGKKPSFLEDLQYLLIGPVFLLAKLFRQYGWRY